MRHDLPYEVAPMKHGKRTKTTTGRRATRRGAQRQCDDVFRLELPVRLVLGGRAVAILATALAALLASIATSCLH